jgi:hypothetical protein
MKRGITNSAQGIRGFGKTLFQAHPSTYPRTIQSCAIAQFTRIYEEWIPTFVTKTWNFFYGSLRHFDTLHSGVQDHRGSTCGASRLWARALERIRPQCAALGTNYTLLSPIMQGTS